MDNWDTWLRRITGGASQSDIARRLGISRATVARWSTRQVIDPETVLKLARTYKVDPVEGLVAGGWLKLQDITMQGLQNIIELAPSVLLAREMLARAEIEHAARKNRKAYTPPARPFDRLL